MRENCTGQNSMACNGVAVFGLRLASVCKTKIGTEVAHVISDSDTTFKVKRSKVKVTRSLSLSAALTRQATAAVSVGTY